MALVDIEGKFHVALDGVGLILQGAPNAPAYRGADAPVFGTRFASGDRDLNDLSQWWYLSQTDWSGGVKKTLSFVDDAKYYYSSNIDTYSRPGFIQLEKTMTSVLNNTANSEALLGAKRVSYGGNDFLVYLDGDDLRTDASTIIGTFTGDVSDYLSFGGFLWAVTITGNVYTFDGTTTSNKKSQIDAIVGFDTIATSSNTMALAILGQSLYVFGRTDTNRIFCVRTSVANPTATADWTLVAQTAVDSNAEMNGIAVLGDKIVFMVENGAGNDTNVLYVFDATSGTINKLRTFASNQSGIYQYGQRSVQTLNSEVLITVPAASGVDGRGKIYSYNGSTLTEIYDTDDTKWAIGNQASAFLRGGCVIGGDRAYWGNLIYDGTSFYNFVKTADDDIAYSCIPIGYDETSNKLYLVDNEIVSGDQQVIAYEYTLHGTSYKTGASNSAFLVMSQQDNLPSIDKLLNTVILGFEPLVSGQSISVYYTTAVTPPAASGSWTLLGTASFSVDGGSVTFKSFELPDGVTAKKDWFRIELVGGGTNTPAVTDFTLEYLPMPDYRFQWSLNVTCADEVKKLDGRSLVETTARELKARLMRAWMTKSTLDYQDVDYATTLLRGSLDATTTTVAVNSTQFFPEQGRIRVDDEEIFYTGKTPNTFTGCTRGARGTRAATHADNAVTNNAYRVLVNGIDVRVPVIAEGKNLEYIVGLSLREV